jgi:hypothetical protein
MRAASAQELDGSRKIPFFPCKPLISLKMAKGIFGNVWRIAPQIWKCLAWVWKNRIATALRLDRVAVVRESSEARFNSKATFAGAHA